MEARIVFKDGTEIIAEKNGDSYIVNQKPEIPEDLSGLVIHSEEGVRTYVNPVLSECASIDGRYWFAFVEEDPRDAEIRMLEDAIIELAELIGG